MYLTGIIADNNSVGSFTRKLINDRRSKTNSYVVTKFIEKYLLRWNFLTYFQVISAIPKEFIESAKVTSLEKNRLPVKKGFPAFIRNLCKPPSNEK